MDISTWLHGLGMQQYEQAFRDNAMDAEVLRKIRTNDLRDLGVNLVAHRRKSLAAIAVLRSEVPISGVPSASIEPERRGQDAGAQPREADQR